MRSEEIYVTPKQSDFLEGEQNDKTFVGGRGTGKSDVIGKQDRIRMNFLPRAKSFLAGPYFGQVITKTLPSWLESIKMMKLVEYDPLTRFGHYVVFKRPPVNWPKPYHEVRDYSKVITFANGYTKEILSMYGADSSRGGSYDCGDVDEVALIDKEDIDRVLIPSLRGNLYRYNTPLHYQFCKYTSPAWLPSGQWIYDYEELAKEFPDEYLFIESRTRDNAAISAHQIKVMERTLPSIVFDVEVDGKRITKLPNGFYPTFNDKKHCVFNTTAHEFDDEKRIWLTAENYLNTNDKLETSWDFNAAFTSLLVTQMVGNEQRFDNALYVKESGEKSMVRALAEKFCTEYKGHAKKLVDIHGDRNGNAKSPRHPLTAYEEIKLVLEANGWTVNILVEGLDSDHDIRHLVMSELLSEAKPSLPKIRINANKCKVLVYAIQNTPILADWKKDKRSEQSNMPQEKATHLTDCFDNILYRKFARLIGASTPLYIAPVFLGGRG